MFTKRLRLKEQLMNLYDVADVENGYNYWFNKLLCFCLGMFEYEGLPDTIPSREIELNLLLTGHCIIFEKDGELYTQPTSVYANEKSVYYFPTKATYANPVLGTQMLKIGDNAEIIYNDPLQDNIFYIPSDGGLRTFIGRYARQLADIESTLNIYTVNMRLTSYPTASSDVVKNSLERFFDKIALGRRGIVSDNAIIEQFRNVDISRSNIKDGITDILLARDKVLEMFFRDIGVRMYNPKKAQVNTEEIESNDQLLVISTKDMLKTRTSGFKTVNEHWGINIRVRLAEAFKIDSSTLKTEIRERSGDNAVKD